MTLGVGQPGGRTRARLHETLTSPDEGETASREITRPKGALSNATFARGSARLLMTLLMSCAAAYYLLKMPARFHLTTGGAAVKVIRRQAVSCSSPSSRSTRLASRVNRSGW